uniref:Large ribosomal subunit protein uL23c n=1 Tax=Schizocladia ischiensis TaxID=196139 RepID=A0A7S6U9X3_9STRA|nr:ribosomal protein L23 [Schizocladia ischiensis]QOW07536.1 ribosomal protein L23 [Schizocladia ischiensis]
MSKLNSNISTTINLIRSPIMTAKAIRLLTNNQYTFLVHPKVTKADAKNTIEFLFNVKIKKITSCNSPKKKKRVGRIIGTRPNYKKVYVRLVEGSTINMFSNI